MSHIFPPILASDFKLAKEINGTRLAALLNNESRRVDTAFYDDFENRIVLRFKDGSERKTPGEIHGSMLTAIHACRRLRIIHHEGGHFTGKPDAEYEVHFG